METEKYFLLNFEFVVHYGLRVMRYAKLINHIVNRGGLLVYS